MGVKQSDVVLNFKMNGQVQFAQTVKDINNIMNTAAREYRNQVSALGENATATQKLQVSKQKLEIQLEGASKRSKILREEYEKSVKETGKYSAESNKLYDKLMRSETAENNLRTALEKTNKELKNQSIFSDELKKNLEKMSNVGDKVTGVGKKLSLLVTAPAAAMTAGLIKNGIEVRKFRAQAQLYYEGLYQDTKKAKDQLDNLMTFAKTTPYSYESIVEADQIMQTFGMSTSKSQQVLEALANTIASTGGTSSDLAALGTVMGQIESSGKLSLQDMNQLINAKIPALKIVGNELGLSVMDLREAISKGEVSSESAIEALTKGLMQGTDGMNGATQAYAGALGNVKQQLPGAVDSMKSAFKNLALELVNEDIFSKMIETINKITEMINSGAMIPVIQNISTALASVLDSVIAVAEWFTGLSPEMQQLIVKVMAFTAILGPMLIIIGKTITGISAIIKVFKSLQLLIGLSNPMMLLIIGIIGAVIAVGVLLYKNWDQIMAKAKELGQGIQQMWENIKSWFSDGVESIESAGAGVGEWWNNLWTSISESFMTFINVIKQGWVNFINWWKTLGETIGKFFTDIWLSAVEIWENLKQSTIDIFNSIVEVVSPILQRLYDVIMVPVSLIQTLLDGLFLFIKAGFEIAWQAVVLSTEFLLTKLSELWRFVTDIGKQAWELIASYIIDPVVRAYDFVIQKFVELGAWISNIFEEIKHKVYLVWLEIQLNIIHPIKMAYLELRKIVMDIYFALWQVFIDLKLQITLIWIDIKFWIIKHFTDAKEGVIKLATNLWEGITNIFESVVTTVSDKFNRVKDAIINPLIEAKDKVKEVLENIKEFFGNLKMPHFKLKTSSKVILGKEISYPSGIDVAWNAKGAIFNKPVVAGSYNGVPQGFGEAGAEAAIPLTAENLGMIGKGIAATMRGVEQHIHFGKVNTGSMNELNELNLSMQRSDSLANFALGGD